jgi:hypothetical protein
MLWGMKLYAVLGRSQLRMSWKSSLSLRPSTTWNCSENLFSTRSDIDWLVSSPRGITQRAAPRHAEIQNIFTTPFQIINFDFTLRSRVTIKICVRHDSTPHHIPLHFIAFVVFMSRSQPPLRLVAARFLLYSSLAGWSWLGVERGTTRMRKAEKLHNFQMNRTIFFSSLAQLLSPRRFLRFRLLNGGGFLSLHILWETFTSPTIHHAVAWKLWSDCSSWAGESPSRVEFVSRRQRETFLPPLGGE